MFNLTVPLLVIVMCVLGGRRHWLGPIIGAVVIYALQERLTNSGLDECGQIVLGGILVVIILFAPEGLYERHRGSPRRAVLAGVALVVGTVVGGLRRLGYRDGLAQTGLAAATVVLLVARPKRRRGGRRGGRTSAPRRGGSRT